MAWVGSIRNDDRAPVRTTLTTFLYTQAVDEPSQFDVNVGWQ